MNDFFYCELCGYVLENCEFENYKKAILLDKIYIFQPWYCAKCKQAFEAIDKE